MMSSRLFKILAILAIPLILLSISSSYIFEWLWLNELGYTEVFWTIRGMQVLLTLAAFLVSAIFIVTNFRYLADRLRQINLAGTPLQNLNIDFARADQHKQLKLILTLFGLFLAFIFAIGFYISWDESLRFVWNVPFGETDPLFGNDIGFYMFQLPFWKLIQSSLTILAFIILIILLASYIFTGLLGARSGEGIQVSPQVLRHLKFNASFWLLMLSWGFYLDRYNLLFRGDGLIYGAGFTHLTVELPTFWILAVLTALIAILLLVDRWISIRRLVPATAILAILVMILGRGVFPGIVQKFNVEPNELELETPYLENNIEMTRLAYGLNEVREVEYRADDTLTISDIRNNQDAINNIRLWDPRLLIQTYKQLQEIRSYYEFYTVDNDRYMIGGETVQTMLSAREIARTLPSQSDTWVNRHMQYTHGYGMVMSPVTQATRQGEPRFLLRDIPPIPSSPELRIENPAIYYGENSDGYYIVNTYVEELHYPLGDQNVYTHYSGQGGIPFSSWFRKLLFAWELSDINILLSDYIHEESRLQVYRSVQERIERIAPFLRLDNDPYLVLNNGGLYWIQDAYTVSEHFPYSQPNRGLNYIRNSVKIVVDAYEGSVDFYIVEENDPVIQVYSSIFPDLFKSMDQLPNGIENHFRYPQDLFEIQLEIYNRYHMVRPQVFYNQEDLWTRPNEKYAGRQVRMEPYYVLARLPGEEELEFMLISPTTPENRDNMIGWMAAKSDPGSYGEIVVYKLPKDRLIFGPSQIEARIDQDPEISRQIALWDQRGSRVIRGNLMVIPIENSFIYVEPVFLLAEGVDIPQLQRVIVSIGENISMQPTIEMALYELFGDEADFLAQPPAEPVIADGEEMIPPAEISPAQVFEINQLEEIRDLWRQIRTAMETGNWTRYGELMRDLDELIGEGE